MPPAPGAFLQDRLAGWVSDLTTLHELTERLTATHTLDSALPELLSAGAALVGARRGLLVLEPADGRGPRTTIGLGLGHADLGAVETVPRAATPHGRIIDGPPATTAPVSNPDLLAEADLDPRHREVAERLGYAASYALPSPPGPASCSARPSGSTTNRPNPWNGSSTWSVSTGGTPPNTWPVSSNSNAPGPIWRSSPRNSCRAGSRASPVCGWPPATAPHRTAVATGTTPCRSRTARSASRWAPRAAPAPARWPRWDGSARGCARTP